MNKFDTSPLRQLFQLLGIEPLYNLPPLAVRQIQQHPPQKDLPAAITDAVNSLRDLAVMSRDYEQIGVLEFQAGLDMLDARWLPQAVEHFEAARRQWIFIDHLPLISLAHLGKGMAHFSAGDHRQAAAAYFNVKQCLQQAEDEPYRWEKLEEERSLQEFWTDLERWLVLAISSLRRDFDDELERNLHLAGGDSTDPVADEERIGEEGDDGTTDLLIQLQPTGPMLAADLFELLCKTVEAIETLNAGICAQDEADDLPPLWIKRIEYVDQGILTIVVTNVSAHVLAFWHRLLELISTESSKSGRGAQQTAASRSATFGEPLSRESEPARSWFTLETGTGRIAAFIKAYLDEEIGIRPGDSETLRLVQATRHLAELRVNCHLTLKSGAT